jgi:GT2 family glycosyltransferase
MGVADGNFPIPLAGDRAIQTGERMTAGLGGQVEIEHYHRYCLARDFAVGRDVLDVASGEGYGAAMLATVARSVVGVEIDAASVAHATRSYARANLRFVAGDALALPIADASIDLAVSFETLEHFADHDGFCREIRRVLRPGGLFIVSTPDRIVYSARGEPINPFHVRELTEGEFRALLSRHFARHAISAQRAVIGSVISGAGGEGWRSFERREMVIEASNGLARAFYFLGFASDRDLDAVGSSVYVETGDVDRVMRAAEAREEAERSLGAVRATAQALREDLQRIEAELALHEDAAARLLEQVERMAALPTTRDLAQRDAALAEERARSAEALARLEATAARLHAIEASETWRATRPLRSFLARHPGLSVGLRRGAKLAWWTVTLQLGSRYALWRNARRQAASAPAPLAAPAVAMDAASLPETPAWPPDPAIREQPADIVICVHNAPDDVRRCLASVKRHTLPPYRIILVDDGSDAPTRDELARFARDHDALLIRHEQAKGYTFAANAGLRRAQAPLVVLLNSDTEVTEGWLDRMAELLARHDDVGMVGPLSNIASWQSAPAIRENEDWARNELPAGMGADDMARLVAAGSRRQGVEIGFLNGFCLLLRRSLLDRVGYFDEATFGAGYGEENDLCIRARQAGWRLMVADDAYVLHHQSRSYGDERRLRLAKAADAALLAKHDFDRHIGPQVHRARDSLLLAHARQRLRAGIARAALAEEGRRGFEGRRIGILLPVAEAGGGANVVLAEALAARAFGVDSWIINIAGFETGFRRGYPSLDLPVRFAPAAQMRRFVDATVRELALDAVVATAAQSFDWLPEARPGLALGYYVQDLETKFFAPGSAEFARAQASYRTRPEVRRFTKTAWNAEAVAALGGARPVVIGPSVDLAQYAPASDDGLDPGRPVRVTAMVRPSTPRRSPQLTLRILRRLKDTLGDRVQLSCFGAEPAECGALGVPLHGIACHGALAADRIAVLLGQVDVFLDVSAWQAMGLTALEAMACGAAVAMPREGGGPEICRGGEAALLVDTADEEACFAAARRLVEDHALRLRLRHAALEAAHDAPLERAGLNMLRVLFDA